MTDQAEALLALAQDDLVVARRNLGDGYPRQAASRTYYALFHAATAALAEAGDHAKTHAGVRRQFGQRSVQDGPFGAEDSRTFARPARLRNDADYHVGREVSAEAAGAALADAAALVDRIAAWLAASASGGGAAP